MSVRLGLLTICFLLFGLVLPVSAQTDPALKTSVDELLDSYLEAGGPRKAELGTGSALANWAVLKGVGIPLLREQPTMARGSWVELWAPVEQTLKEKGFSTLRPLKAITYFEESTQEPERFVRLLGREGLLDPKEGPGRDKGRDLREAISRARLEMKSVRSSARYEDAGWQFTGTAFLNSANRIVRVAISGSQPCKITGSARTLNLNLKGRIYEDSSSPSGLKVQLLDNEFLSRGCELVLKDRVDSVQRLAGGGEAKMSANLNLIIKDELVTGRFQIDLVSKQAGLALLTGRAVYSVRGSVDSSGDLTAKLVSVSASGSRILRQQLEKEGSLTGNVTNSVGSGKITLPALKDPLKWSDSRKPAPRKSTK